MTDQKPAEGPRLRPRRVLVLALISAAVALALTLWIGNPKPTECPVQKDAAAKIDAAAIGQLAALNGTGKGRGYATLAFNDANDKPMTIADFKGKKLLVNFWASWCIPCREEMPALENLAAKYHSDDFAVVAINLDIGEDAKKKALTFLADGKWAYLPLYADPTFKAFERLKTEAVSIGLPTTLLLDENGCELGVLQGPAEWDTPDGDNVIKAFLGA